MDFNIEIRKKQLDNLDQLVSSSRSRIQSVLGYLGWTQENVEKGDNLVVCPINPHHRIHPKSWNEHIEKCLVKIEGYSSKSQFLSESLDNPTQSINIDRNKKIELITKELTEKGTMRLEKDFDEVITQLNIFTWNGLDPDPRTSDRLISTFSPDERLAFYNYSVANTMGPPQPPEFTTIHNKKQNEEKSLTYEEILAQERDAKRRRAKYKSVHLNRKKHTEVIREVINGQMEEYKEWLLAQEQSKNNGIYDDRKEELERPHSSISRNSNHSSSSRSTNRKYERYRDDRDRSRKQYKSRSRDRNEDRNSKVSPREEGRRRRHRSRERGSRERDRKHSSRGFRERSRHGYDERRRY